MNTLGRVQEVCGSSCAGKRGRYLLADDARLSDPRQHDLSPAGENLLDGLDESIIDFFDQCGYGVRLDAEHSSGLIEDLFF